MTATISPMPVITCPDCGRDVSTLATACPHCGRPSPAGLTPLTGPAQALPPEKTLWQGTPSPMLLAGHVIGIVVALVAIPVLVRFFAATMPDETRASGLMRVGWIITAILVFVQVTAFLVAWIKLRSTGYTITNQRVQIEQGIFS